jgi:hypothetical protein
VTRVERACLNAAIAWWEADHKQLAPGEDNPGDPGMPIHDDLVNAIGDLINERANERSNKQERKKCPKSASRTA